MTANLEKDFTEVTFHGRGGQGAITASNLLCAFAFEEGYNDVLDIPKIGAERRGAPIQAFSKLSKEKEIKDFCAIKSADYTLVFDFTLLDIPSVATSLKGTVIINAPDFVDLDCIAHVKAIWLVDATNIAINNNLMISGYPILNTLMLGAYAKVTGQYTLETMKKVLNQRFGSRGEQNYIAAKEAFESVKKVRG
ncbi:MAG: pyruvate ferredoxin oxidoreductase [Candidatus Lokiarchaeota archaeon]|nr:pyruvate ferredoxin oxidoreductase [Candidatus Lokiarchaeota archaeon]